METPGLAGFENYKLPTGFPISAYDTPSVLVGKQPKDQQDISANITWVTSSQFFHQRKGFVEMFARWWFQSVRKIFNQDRTLGGASCSFTSIIGVGCC